MTERRFAARSRLSAAVSVAPAAASCCDLTRSTISAVSASKSSMSSWLPWRIVEKYRTTPETLVASANSVSVTPWSFASSV